MTNSGSPADTTAPETPGQWHIVQRSAGHCDIVETLDETTPATTWGPFKSRAEAIAKRVGLIRAGKCLPK